MTKPPEYLDKETAKWFKKVCSDYEMQDHHIKILTLAAQAWDRSQQAEAVIRAEGITIKDAKGITRNHPAITTKKEAEVIFARLIRELALDIDTPRETRLPRGW